MIDQRYKPSWLPQISAPFSYTLDMLDKEGVDYKFYKADPSEVSPSQGLILLDKVSQVDSNNIKPIWTSIEDRILDGHHRWGSSYANEKPIKLVKIFLPFNDAARVLNKIQDIYEFQNQESIEEVVAQEYLNYENDPSIIDYLEEENNQQYKENIAGKKIDKISAYRKGNISENSLAGNFFSVKPIEGYSKYDIEFDNLLNTDDMGLVFYGNNNPVFVLAKTWFPNINFSKFAKKHDVSIDALVNRAVAEKAKSLNYDGIKYGDIMIQGLN